MSDLSARGMGLLIAFEGAGKVGKTTLIEAFHKVTNIPIWRRPSIIEEFKEKTKSWDMFCADELSLLEAVNWKKQDLIVDRHPAISEWIYSNKRNRPSTLVVAEETVISLMRKMPSALIYLQATPELLLERGSKRDVRKELGLYNFFFTVLADEALPLIHLMVFSVDCDMDTRAASFKITEWLESCRGEMNGF